MDIGLLDDGGQCLFGEPSRLQETWKVAALAQLGDAQLDRPGSRLPVAIAVAVALGETVGALLAVRGASQRPDLQLHQPLGGEADHLAHNVSVGGLLHERAKAHHLVGHLKANAKHSSGWFLGCVGVSQPDPTGESPVTTASRSLATALSKARFASALLRLSYTTPGDTTAAVRIPHSHSIVPGHSNMRFSSANSFCARRRTVSAIRQKNVLLISKTNFDNPRFARFQRLSTAFGRFLTAYPSEIAFAQAQKRPSATPRVQTDQIASGFYRE